MNNYFNLTRKQKQNKTEITIEDVTVQKQICLHGWRRSYLFTLQNFKSIQHYG